MPTPDRSSAAARPAVLRPFQMRLASPQRRNPRVGGARQSRIPPSAPGPCPFRHSAQDLRPTPSSLSASAIRTPGEISGWRGVRCPSRCRPPTAGRRAAARGLAARGRGALAGSRDRARGV